VVRRLLYLLVLRTAGWDGHERLRAGRLGTGGWEWCCRKCGAQLGVVGGLRGRGWGLGGWVGGCHWVGGVSHCEWRWDRGREVGGFG
jgi:hypothetical protein